MHQHSFSSISACLCTLLYDQDTLFLCLQTRSGHLPRSNQASSPSCSLLTPSQLHHAALMASSNGLYITPANPTSQRVTQSCPACLHPSRFDRSSTELKPPGVSSPPRDGWTSAPSHGTAPQQTTHPRRGPPASMRWARCQPEGKGEEGPHGWTAAPRCPGRMLREIFSLLTSKLPRRCCWPFLLLPRQVTACKHGSGLQHSNHPTRKKSKKLLRDGRRLKN